MASTTKQQSGLDAGQTQRKAFNDDLAVMSVDGFVTSKVGHKITLTLSQTSVANDTETFEYFDDATSLMTIKIVYTDGNRTVMTSTERLT